MYYVYLIRSVSNPTKTYVGQTSYPEMRLKYHNRGLCTYTANFMPWKLVSVIGFNTKKKALSFEKYLKSGSGHTFAKNRFW